MIMMMKRCLQVLPETNTPQQHRTASQIEKEKTRAESEDQHYNCS
jgi:hypothetical protein